MAESKWPEVKEKLNQIEGWCRNGLTNEQIAKNLGINPDTLYTYKREYPELAEVLKRGKEVVDLEVENALLKRALGYEYEEVTYERVEHVVVEPNGEMHLEPGTKIRTIIKQVQPDTTAQIFWLKNRKPREWRDRQDVNVSGGLNNTTTDLTSMTKEERADRIKELQEKNES